MQIPEPHPRFIKVEVLLSVGPKTCISKKRKLPLHDFYVHYIWKPSSLKCLRPKLIKAAGRWEGRNLEDKSIVRWKPFLQRENTWKKSMASAEAGVGSMFSSYWGRRRLILDLCCGTSSIYYMGTIKVFVLAQCPAPNPNWGFCTKINGAT